MVETADFEVAPRVRVTPESVERGQSVAVGVTGFGPGESVRVRWLVGSSYVQLATLVTAANGSGTVNVTVPADAAAGANSVRAAVLNIDGPGQYELPMLGIYFSMDNWVATGKARVRLAGQAPRGRHGQGRTVGHELRYVLRHFWQQHTSRASRPPAVISVCHEPGCHTIFEEASPTFKKRFMYMSGITDEAEFDKMRQGDDLGGSRRQGQGAVSLRRRRVR